MDTMKVFLKRMFVVFLARVRPDSSVAKPRCMMNTRPAASIIQALFAVNCPGVTPSSAMPLAGSKTPPVSSIAATIRFMVWSPPEG
jgi:hypothetical protein